MRPTPIAPIVIRLLAASAPKTDEGTIVGKPTTPIDVAKLRMKSLRDDVWTFSVLPDKRLEPTI
jgi:hypothetical protein